ncbi:MAG: hypothetical protein JKY65_06015 [Planctomycetes bacterium]|nr:hypothetical protein [Planctomycetota bacterium]
MRLAQLDEQPTGGTPTLFAPLKRQYHVSFRYRLFMRTPARFGQLLGQGLTAKTSRYELVITGEGEAFTKALGKTIANSIAPDMKEFAPVLKSASVRTVVRVDLDPKSCRPVSASEETKTTIEFAGEEEKPSVETEKKSYKFAWK